MSKEEGSKLILNFRYEGSSFFDFLRVEYPHFLPHSNLSPDQVREVAQKAIHGTTVLALTYQEGVVMGGDRMATEGFQVSSRRIEKVYKADEHTAIAIAGAAGPSIELARLFQTELEHYEKIEGEELVLDGKANKLAQMVRQNLPAAMQGLIVVPLLAGYDTRRKVGRIFKYDITGGRYEEEDFYAIGSGGKDARSTLKKLYVKNLSREEAITLALTALFDAADEDIGTGGPDLIRGIFPSMKMITSAGMSDVSESEMKSLAEIVLNERRDG
ncbi:MAG: proteasome subunit beta [Candidatus Tectomicrobia bacterium]|nr:proteasome subunit beta [Candidatus Tectomicrobia bacterium]